MNFGTKEITEKIVKSKYTTFGINEDITIGTIKGVKPENGSEFIDINLFPSWSAEEFSTSVRLYMSDKAKDKSMEKLVHLGTKITTRKEIDSIESTNIEDYGTKLNKMLNGGRIRLKLKGREYIKLNGNKGVRLEFPFPSFAEPITDGAEYPAITLANSKLRFDQENVYDYERLKPQTTLEETVKETTNDLPM